MATVTKRVWTDAKGRVQEAWRVSYTDNQGKRRHVQKRTKRDADAYRIKVESEVAIGIHTADAASVTVKEACAIWLSKGEAEGLEWGTLKQRRNLIGKHIVPLMGDEKLSRLTMPKVEAFRDTLVQTRSRVMAGKVVRGFSSMLIEGMRQGLVAQNVARNVKVKKNGRDEAPLQIPEVHELKAILEAAERLGNEIPETYPMLLLAISAGLRGSELRGLRWADIDLGARTVTIRQRADQRGVIGKCKTKAAYRTIPLAPPVVSAFKTWRLRCPLSPLGLVFPNEKGRPIHPNNLREYRWEPVLVACGMATPTGRKNRKGRKVYEHKYGMHDLRHACASRWIKQRVDIKRITTWLGHATVAITVDIYGHLLRDDAEDAAIMAAVQAELMA